MRKLQWNWGPFMFRHGLEKEETFGGRIRKSGVLPNRKQKKARCALMPAVFHEAVG